MADTYYWLVVLYVTCILKQVRNRIAWAKSGLSISNDDDENTVAALALYYDTATSVLEREMAKIFWI